MDDRRRKNQLVLAFMEESRSEAPTASVEGTESSAGKRGIESPAVAEQLMEEVCGRENCEQALKRVKANKGSPGVDGMTVHDLAGYLKQHWPAIREQLSSGTYKPQPVRRVEIPRPDGGVRKLGIPTVLDRFIQQAVMQVLQSKWDRTFSEGYRWCVNLDLEKFFDRVSHDKLMARIETRVGDRRLLRLIRGVLKAGVMEGGLVSPVDEGTPQGGPRITRRLASRPVKR
jgi:RNA-directed DNA polymerase